MFGIWHIQKIIAECVDDGCIPVLADALEVILIVLMDMAVNHVARVIAIHHIQKGFKPDMRQIGVVAQMARGGMGQQNIDAAAAPEFEAQTIDALAHFPFGVLVDPSVIAHGTAEAENAKTADGHDMIFDALAALRRMLVISVVVVAADIEDRRGGEAGETLSLIHI